MSATTSEDILKHIIKDIVTRATHTLKKRKVEAMKNSLNNENNNEQNKDANNDLEDVKSNKNTIKNIEKNDEDNQKLTNEEKLKKCIDTLVLYSGIFENLSYGSNSTYVSETLAAFIVRSVVLSPENHFNVEREFNKGEVERLIQISVNQIILQNSPVMETVKMQVYFDSHFSSQADYLYKEKNTRVNSCAALLKEMLDFNGRTMKSLEGITKKKTLYIQQNMNKLKKKQ